MIVKRGIGSYIFDFFNVTFLTLLSVICLYPFLYVVFVSVSDAKELANWKTESRATAL